MTYIKDDFLLNNKTSQKLYNEYAKDVQIFDYHCHLPEKQILENKKFNDVFEIWLAGDHYKWRLMRNYGVDEELITGNASNKDKFIAYCKTLSTAFGNPLYHWSQVELKDFFNCELEINEENALTIWDWCNDYIALNNVTPQSLIEKANVKYIFTTNEIFDDLTTFEEIAKKDYKFKVYPAFRADKIMNCDAKAYPEFIKKLEDLTFEINDIEGLEKAVEKRLLEFLKVGARASDISLERALPIYDRNDADAVFKKAKAGKGVTQEEADVFKGYLTYYLMKLYGKLDVATELHLGPTRNNNTKMFEKLGADSGFDGVSECNSTANLSKLFDALNNENCLPKTILFNLNGKMNAEFVVLLGCFQDSSTRGKMQYGPAWWFLDNKQGMEKHLLDLTATGHIGSFIGMLTDSRSLLSYPRHHYFRRILCNYFGTMMEKGEMTQNIELVGKVVKDICLYNAERYFKM